MLFKEVILNSTGNINFFIGFTGEEKGGKLWLMKKK
jgi:hypothetical protein